MMQSNWFVIKKLVKLQTDTYYFQSVNRGTDMSLTLGMYLQRISEYNDFLGPVGTYNFRFLSAPPKKIHNYLTLLNPFDGYVWALLIASVLAITITLIIIDTAYTSWTNTSKKDIIYQSTFRMYTQHYANMDLGYIVSEIFWLYVFLEWKTFSLKFL